MFHEPNLTERPSAFKITGSLNITVVYLVFLALSCSSLIQFKGLFDQPSLPLPLPLRVVRGVCGAIELISEEEEEEEEELSN